MVCALSLSRSLSLSLSLSFKKHTLTSVRVAIWLLSDPGGWSGYAGIRVGDYKLVLGWPGVPDSWCWPNQNDTSTEALHIRNQLNRNASLAEVTKGGLPCSRGPHDADEEGRCSIDLGIAQTLEGGDVVVPPQCAVPPHAKTERVACPAHDLHTVPSPTADGCCAACAAVETCAGYTWRPKSTSTSTAEGGNGKVAECFLKTDVSACEPDAHAISAHVIGRSPSPSPGPKPAAPYPGPLTCGYTGKVPPPELRTKPMLFNLKTDPGEHTDLAAAQPATVKTLMARLQTYIDSTVEPLNMYSCKAKKGPGCRGTDPGAVAAAAAANAWVPWK